MKKILTAVLCAVLCLGTVVALPLGFAGCGDDNTIVVGYTLYEPMNYEENGDSRVTIPNLPSLSSAKCSAMMSNFR